MSDIKNKFLAAMPANTIKGNNTGGSAKPVDLSATQATAMLNPFTSSLQGLVPASGGGTSNFLRADGTFATPGSTGGVGPGTYAQAYFGVASSWSTTSNSFADPTNSGGNALTVRQSNNLALTAASSNGLGVTFTPNDAASAYLIIANMGLYNNSVSSANSYAQLTDGTTVIATHAGIQPVTGASSGFGPTNLSGIFKPGTTNPVTVKIQIAASAGTTQIVALTNGVSVEWTIIRIDTISPSTKPMTVQTFLSGSGTYTTPANVTHIKVRMVGGGGGGGGTGGSTGPQGASGGTTTFNSVDAVGGTGGTGATGTNGGAGGGGGANGSGTATLRMSGAPGMSGPGALSGTNGGGLGGAAGGGFGGGGQQPASAVAGYAGLNYGGGGSGCGTGGASGTTGGGGGGEYAELLIPNPSNTFSYSVGSGGAGGVGTGGGAQTGGAGAPGIIIVEEYYAVVAATPTGAQFVGAITITSTGQKWSTSSGSFGAFSVIAGPSYTTSGNALAPSTNVPGIKFSSLIAGEYVIQAEGIFGAEGTGITAQFQFSDGTTTSREFSGIANGYCPGITQSFNYGSPKSNVTWQIFGRVQSGSGSGVIYDDGGAGYSLVIKVYWYPSVTW